MISVHHVGYLVKRIETGRRSFEILGFSACGGTVYDAIRDVEILFMSKDGYVIELVSPVTEASVVANLIRKHRNGPYHMCLRTDNFETDLEALISKGFLQIDEPRAAPAIHNCRICFLMNSQIGLVELLEAEEVK